MAFPLLPSSSALAPHCSSPTKQWIARPFLLHRPLRDHGLFITRAQPHPSFLVQHSLSSGGMASCWCLSPHAGWQPYLSCAFTGPTLGRCQPSFSGPAFFIGQSYSRLEAQHPHLMPPDVQRAQTSIPEAGETLRVAQAFASLSSLL